MRGKAPQGLPHGADFGITPAYAGKRVIRSGFHKLFQDHPRLCGEKTFSQTYTDAKIGSPPPMRGKVWVHQSSPPVIMDHPRLCGEKVGGFNRICTHTGSPPPMRGKD